MKKILLAVICTILSATIMADDLASPIDSKRVAQAIGLTDKTEKYVGYIDYDTEQIADTGYSVWSSVVFERTLDGRITSLVVDGATIVGPADQPIAGLPARANGYKSFNLNLYAVDARGKYVGYGYLFDKRLVSGDLISVVMSPPDGKPFYVSANTIENPNDTKLCFVGEKQWCYWYDEEAGGYEAFTPNNYQIFSFEITGADGSVLQQGWYDPLAETKEEATDKINLFGISWVGGVATIDLFEGSVYLENQTLNGQTLPADCPDNTCGMVPASVYLLKKNAEDGWFTVNVGNGFVIDVYEWKKDGEMPLLDSFTSSITVMSYATTFVVVVRSDGGDQTPESFGVGFCGENCKG